MDESGCRVVRLMRCAPSDPPPGFPPEHLALRELFVEYPYVVDVECCDPVLAAQQRAWDATHERR